MSKLKYKGEWVTWGGSEGRGTKAHFQFIVRSVPAWIACRCVQFVPIYARPATEEDVKCERCLKEVEA